jgi:AmmeMemoRadiSam system protein B
MWPKISWREDSMGIRSADFSGAWYPGSKRECVAIIEEFKRKVTLPQVAYKGLGGIVPHAGWFFSGKTALSVFMSIKEKKVPDTVFLFGMHLPPGGPDFLFVDDGVETPLGAVMVNREATRALFSSFDFIKEDAASYTRDNTIEIQLPFLKYFFPDATVVLAGISPGKRSEEIGKAVAKFIEDEKMNACVVGSTDLTHYGPNYGFTPEGIGSESVKWVKEKNDRAMVEAFVGVAPDEVMEKAAKMRNACCPGSAAAAVAAVRALGAERGVLVEYTTSYDIQPDSSFVGYTGVVY